MDLNRSFLQSYTRNLSLAYPPSPISAEDFRKMAFTAPVSLQGDGTRRRTLLSTQQRYSDCNVKEELLALLSPLKHVNSLRLQ